MSGSDTDRAAHPWAPVVSFDGGDLDCGNGLLLMIRQHIDPLDPGQLLEIVSAEASVEEDLPSWCRLTGNELVDLHKHGRQRRFLVSKGAFPGQARNNELASTPPLASKKQRSRTKPQMAVTQAVVAPFIPTELPAPAPAPVIEPLSVLSVGSWPRPRWLLHALHEHLQGRLGDADFNADADDAVRLAVAAQLRAGVDVVSDGEQRRDNYSSFVGGLLENCQLIPITDLLPYVDDPDQFGRELEALDVPAGEVRHPAVFGPLGRRRPLAVHEAQFVQQLTDKPIKVSLPGPYLLSRTMWMECISDRAYDDREHLARDVLRVLDEEIHHLLASGVSLIQLDEPVLTEVLYGQAGGGGRTFMCGALGERQDIDEELAFAGDLLQELSAGLPAERLAIHVCRGNWSPDETNALAGDYRPLVPLLGSLNVGTVVLELCTARAGELHALRGLREDQRVGVGVINQKHQHVETIEEVADRARQAVTLFGRERVLLNTDCGFATFADNPIVTAELAEAKMHVLAQVRDKLRST
ncbi:MAG: 5-methyltetrahydropteroyltriglutamate--homocysteine methyltransferase [Actinomycetota bacterium]|nr:5-methyltetrahydropteroyltriglutamate--homocysteine methyltransferase [Actinomycetota bacterium]